MLIKNSNSGFTLIELLIVTTIILTILGGGMAAFLAFNQKQAVLGAAKELQSDLRLAQGLARVRETPEGCGQLSGYIVRTQDLDEIKQVQIIADCSSGEVEQHNFTLPAGVTLSDDLEMTFLGLHGGVTGAGVIQVINGQGLIYQFEVDSGGEITQGDFI